MLPKPERLPAPGPDSHVARWRSALVMLGTLVLAACGGGGDEATAEREQPQAVGAVSVSIGSPASGTVYEAGDTLTVSVSGKGADGLALPASRLSWWVDLHHDDHAHPMQLPTTGTGGTVPVPTRGETSSNVWLRVYAKATDASGATVQTTRNIYPRKAPVTLATQPAGLRLSLDGTPVATPLMFTGVVGIERDLGAAPDQTANGRRWRFIAWDHSAQASNTISTPASNTTYIARYGDNGPSSNALPTVSLGDPGPVTLGQTVALSATAADTEGRVTKVEFFDGTRLIGSDTSAPFTLAWSPTATGTHELRARATDDIGALATGAPVEVDVDGPRTGGLKATYFANTTLTGTPVITRVEKVDVVYTGTRTPGAGAPANGWSARWTGSLVLPASGSYTLQLIADDGARLWFNGKQLVNRWSGGGNATYTLPAFSGSAGARLPITIEHYDGTGDSTVRLRWKTPAEPSYWNVVPAAQLASDANASPSVTLGAPSTALLGAATTLTAIASDRDGTIARVAFYDGSTLIGTDTSAPYSVSWTPASTGARSLTAVATDNAGAITRSSAVVVAVSAPSGEGLSASYFANTTLGGTAALQRVEKLDLVYTGSSTPGAGIPADRWSARWTGSIVLPTTGSYTFQLIADDGARAWVNGQQFANKWSEGGNATYVSAVISGTAGTRVPVTVEHFDGTGDSTVRLRWRAPADPDAWNVVPVAQLRPSTSTTNSPPTVSLAALARATTGVPVTLSATASDRDGTVARVAFYDGGTLIGTDTTAPYSVAWTPPAAGTRALTARATDNAGATATSATQLVTVSNPSSGGDTTPPTITLTAPANLASALDGTITVSASASDNIGVTGVEFMVDGAPIGSLDTSAPYAVSLDTTRFATGQHLIRARARDAAGNLSSWALATVRFSGASFRNVSARFTRNESWVTGLGSATAFTQAPDGRFFVAVQTGRLVIVKNGAKLATPFLSLPTDSNGERGLLGVALHPSFATNGWVYVYYTYVNGTRRNNRISRFVANGDVATGAETVIADLPDVTATIHNGGAMHFGPDGKLYVAVGDNSYGTKAQDKSDPFGKILRFNADGSIPTDNPFCTTNGRVSCAVWAYGLRNPFTFAFQPGTGRMHINDVGQSAWEEINLGARGANYGWPISEGPLRLASGMTGPIFTYPHEDPSPLGSGPGGFFTGKAVVGGTFYPSSGPFPAAFRGKYLFADYVYRWIGVLDPAGAGGAYTLANLGGFVVDMRVGNDGQVYVLTRDTIIRLSYL